MECVTPPVLLLGFLSSGDSESVVLIDSISPSNNNCDKINTNINIVQVFPY